MLFDFLTENREKIIDRTRSKISDRPAPRASQTELEHGIPLFLTQLIGMLREGNRESVAEIGAGASRHGEDLSRMGLTVGQVVHDYGGLCQAITEIAGEDRIPISNGEFKTLNGCLDDAIASAVTQFGRKREQAASEEGAAELGFLVHELRNALNAATLAFEVVKTGAVGTRGSTSKSLDRSLRRMRELIDRSLVDVRLKAGMQRRSSLSVARLFEELSITAELEAKNRGLQFSIGPVAGDVRVDADPHILVSALENLLQNAFKFSRPEGHVSLQMFSTDARVQIEIQDECGGLPGGDVEDLFRVFEQRGQRRSGLGLGLAISRQAVEACGGTIQVRNLPGSGCVFSVELPRQQ